MRGDQNRGNASAEITSAQLSSENRYLRDCRDDVELAPGFDFLVEVGHIGLDVGKLVGNRQGAFSFELGQVSASLDRGDHDLVLEFISHAVRVPPQQASGKAVNWRVPGTASRTAKTAFERDNSAQVGETVLIVDDHSGFRAHARRLLESEGYLVIGEAADSASALEAARELAPQLVLVDVHLPDANGFDLSTRLGQLDDPPIVVLTSTRAGGELEQGASDCGACGFVSKAALSREAIEELLR